MTITHLVVRTNFHTGATGSPYGLDRDAIVSRHRSRAAAEDAARRWRRGAECQCGCVGVVAATEAAETAEDAAREAAHRVDMAAGDAFAAILDATRTH